jgi:hypothetical protein
LRQPPQGGREALKDEIPARAPGRGLPGCPSLEAQTPEKKPSPFKDPEDGAFDVGGWIATRTGILPIPIPITEPAIGYGGALALVWIHGAAWRGCAMRRRA